MEPCPPRDATQRHSSSPELLPRDALGARGVGAVLSLLSALVAVTCAAQGVIADPPAVPAAVAPAAPPIVVSAPGAPATIERVATRSSPSRVAPELARFEAALAALESGARADPVRILWLGDSHTSADYLPGAVRAALYRRYPAGGPGFVRLGASPYRHDLAIFNRTGRFRTEPERPSRRSPQGDGVFGLGGVRVSPNGEHVRMTLKLARGALRGRARHTLLFDLPELSAFVVTLGGERVAVTHASAGIRVPESPILRLELEGEPNDVLEVVTTLGRPHFYGAIVEGTEPGVVLDTLGIDGARIATALAWSEPPFVAEVRARRPDLAVIAYGTNEAFDALNVKAYETELELLVGRLRRGAPELDCLVLGPPDALDASGISAPRIADIAEVYARTAAALGCAFVNAQTLMGGPGAFGTWLRREPRLARPDRIHLTPLGYRRLGELVALSAFGELVDGAEGRERATKAE